MFHQTLIPSFPSSASSSSPFFLLHANNAAAAPPAPAPCSSSLRDSAMPSYANHNHGPLDGRADAMKSCGFPPEETAEEATAALVERDGFSVEDLLDLQQFAEPDKDGADHDGAPLPPPPTSPPAEETAKEKSPDDSQPSSIVTYEMAPPEMVDLPAHDVEEELEWVSRIMDDSLSELPPPPQQLAMAAASHAARPPLAHRRPHDGAYRALPAPPPPPPGTLRTPTICALSTEAVVPVKARRSKRSRSSAWSLSGASLFSDSTSSSSTTTTSSCSSSSASLSPFFRMDSHTFGGYPDLEGHNNPHLMPRLSKKSKHSKGGKQKPKKRGRKPKNASQLTGAAAASAAACQAIQGDRRCSHCGVQKTPQWRAGPEGAKTLCNACGVRYKSGRLLPEYRPACSPTFVSTIHSNSHRKVLEMRRKKESGGGSLIATNAAHAVTSF